MTDPERPAPVMTASGARGRRSTFFPRVAVLLLAPLAIVLCAVLLEGRVTYLADEAPREIRIAPSILSGPMHGPTDFTAMMEEAEKRIVLGRERVANGQGEWLRAETLAAGLLARFDLEGDYADLVEARRILAEAQAMPPKGSGPNLRQAVAAMKAHNLKLAEAQLAIVMEQAVPPPRSERAAVLAIRGDIAFYRGDQALADQYYRRAAATDPVGDFSWQRAVLALSRAEFEHAIASFAQVAGQRATPFIRARIALRIGAAESARGNWDRAGQFYRAADAFFPGYWLTKAHLAEASALSGDMKEAVALMTEAARMSDAPEVMDALAMMYRSMGERRQSNDWAERAGAIWSTRLQQSPAAAAAHAAEHELVFGSPERALELARRNLNARPYGEARLLYANALIANGRIAAARSELAAAEREGWRSAPLYAAMANAAAIADDTEAAAEAREQALAINPGIFKAEARLAWFGHG